MSTLECVCQLEQKEMESHTHLKLCMENNAQTQQLYATANQRIHRFSSPTFDLQTLERAAEDRAKQDVIRKHWNSILLIALTSSLTGLCSYTVTCVCLGFIQSQS